MLFVLIGYLGVSYHVEHQLKGITESKIQEPVLVSEKKRETVNLIAKLKHYGLWEIPGSEEVPRFFIESFPPDLNKIKDISVKKRVFLHSLLPHALLVRQETLYKRKRLKSVLSKSNCVAENLDFAEEMDSGNKCSLTEKLAEDDVNFIKKLCKEYRTTSAETLLKRVDVVPVSIILAQGALESSWGSSRFTREGNSIFGMWTWKTAGIVPSQREEGKSHKVKVYDNVLESVRAYHLTLNRLDSYEEFRQLRRYSDNPLILAEGLTLYSERGDDYVEDIKNVIMSNNLQKYESFSLDNFDLPEFTGPVSGAINLAEQSKASL
jgi:Bax protein